MLWCPPLPSKPFSFWLHWKILLSGLTLKPSSPSKQIFQDCTWDWGLPVTPCKQLQGKKWTVDEPGSLTYTLHLLNNRFKDIVDLPCTCFWWIWKKPDPLLQKSTQRGLKRLQYALNNVEQHFGEQPFTNMKSRPHLCPFLKKIQRLTLLFDSVVPGKKQVIFQSPSSCFLFFWLQMLPVSAPVAFYQMQMQCRLLSKNGYFKTQQGDFYLGETCFYLRQHLWFCFLFLFFFLNWTVHPNDTPKKWCLVM